LFEQIIKERVVSIRKIVYPNPAVRKILTGKLGFTEKIAALKLRITVIDVNNPLVRLADCRRGRPECENHRPDKHLPRGAHLKPIALAALSLFLASASTDLS
jgi:hypothetical protein